MPRTKIAALPDPESAEEPESVASEETLAVAEAQAALDKALMEQLAEQQDEPRQTMQEAFDDVAKMIASTKRTTHLSEQTIVKLWELQLMWTLNTRRAQ